MKPKLLILNYHQIISNSDKKPQTPFYSSIDQFKNQISLLCESEINLVPLHQKPTTLSLSKLNVAITFDDCNQSDYAHAFPLLSDKGISATLFISPKAENNVHFDIPTVKKMVDAGFTIGSHGLTHRSFLTLKPKERLTELVESRKILENAFSKPVLSLAFPFGQYNESILLETQEAGFTSAYTTRFKYNVLSENTLLLHRWSIRNTTTIEEFKKVINENSFTALRKKTVSQAAFLVSKIISNDLKLKIHSFINHS